MVSEVGMSDVACGKCINRGRQFTAHEMLYTRDGTVCEKVQFLKVKGAEGHFKPSSIALYVA